MSVSPTSPGTLFGGTWEAWGSGRVPVCVNTSDTDFNTVEKTGGSKTHALTTAEQPNHRHTIPSLSGSTAAGGDHNHKYGTVSNQSAVQPVASSSAIAGPWGNANTINDGIHTHTLNTIASNTGYSGSGNPHNNLQPYITCYMWKRIA